MPRIPSVLYTRRAGAGYLCPALPSSCSCVRRRQQQLCPKIRPITRIIGLGTYLVMLREQQLEQQRQQQKKYLRRYDSAPVSVMRTAAGTPKKQGCDARKKSTSGSRALGAVWSFVKNKRCEQKSSTWLLLVPCIYKHEIPKMPALAPQMRIIF